MSYTKQTWANGDIITSEKLNHMEDGIGSSGVAEILIDHITFDEDDKPVHTLDKTVEELLTGLEAGTIYFLKGDTPITDPPPEVIYHLYGSFMYYEHEEGAEYKFSFYGTVDPFVAYALDEYPTFTESWS